MFPFHRRRIANTRRSVRKKRELAANYEEEVQELASLYRQRGLSRPWRAGRGTAYGEGCAGRSCPGRAGADADQFGAPLQAAIFSAFSFSAGALLPVIIAASAGNAGFPFVILATLFAGYSWLYLLGCGNASPLKAIIRITFWSAMAMALSMGPVLSPVRRWPE